MLKKISDFATERGVDRGSVNAWIRNHPEVNKVCVKQGKEKVIDTFSDEYKLLEEQYPLPKPIEIIEDTESRNELLKTQKMVIQLQAQLAQASQQAALAQANQLLLEDKEKQLAKAESKLDEREKELDLKRTENEDLKFKLHEMEVIIERYENRSFLERLFNKK